MIVRLLLWAVLFLAPTSALAAGCPYGAPASVGSQIHLIPSGDTKQIGQATSECRMVTNPGPGTRMVYDGYDGEWQSFIDHPNGLIMNACPPTLPCAEYGGYCWLLGNHSQSCTAVCADVGMAVDMAGTRDFAGSNGTNEACAEVLMCLTGEAVDPYDPFNGIRNMGWDIGCGVIDTLSPMYIRGTAPTTAEATHAAGRVCACQPDPCETGPVGAVCADGAVYAGKASPSLPRMYVADSDESGTYAWGPVGDDGAADDMYDGFANTDALVADGHGHPAAQACRNRGADWYLPSTAELYKIYLSRASLGPANLPTGFSWYWTSTEFNSTNAKNHRFNGGLQTEAGKTVSYLIRCVRR